MAKKPVKKNSAKIKKAVSRRPAAKKTGKSKPAGKKTSVKKPLTDKERELRAANLIANSEKKKKTPAKKRKKSATPEQTTGLLDAVVEGMRERKGKNIMVMNLTELENRVTDY